MKSPDKSTRIAVIGPSAERYKGGIAQFTQVLVSRLSETCEVYFASWLRPYPPFLIRREFRDQVSTVAVSDARADFVLDYLNPLTWLACARRIRDFNAEKIILTWNHPVHAPVYFALACYLKRVCDAEIVYLCHNVLPHEPVPSGRFLSKMVLRSAERIIVHSQSERAIAEQLVPGVRVDASFLPAFTFFSDGANSPLERLPRGGGHQGRRILFFGNIRAYKGLDTLLEAMPSVREAFPDVTLCIAGEDFTGEESGATGHRQSELVSTLAERIAAHGLETIVELRARYIPNDEVPGLFKNADLAVFPYVAASQSGCIALAYAFGLPVISTNVGGLRDVVAEGITGYTVPPQDPTALAQAIIRFFKDPISQYTVRMFALRLSWPKYISILLGTAAEDLTEDGSQRRPLQLAERTDATFLPKSASAALVASSKPVVNG